PAAGPSSAERPEEALACAAQPSSSRGFSTEHRQTRPGGCSACCRRRSESFTGRCGGPATHALRAGMRREPVRQKEEITMKLTISGAPAATGKTLPERALAAGHEVTAVVRTPARLSISAQPRLRVITADVIEPASITPAVEGADAVISAVGPR